MFKLFSKTGSAAFESIGSDSNQANDYAYASFAPSTSMQFTDLTTLKTDYAFTTGDCHGGSLRWSVRIDANDNHMRDNTDPAIFIYYGAYPQFGNGGVNGCTPTSNQGVDQSGVNLLASPGPRDDLRFDTSQLTGGTFYDSYAHAVQLTGTHEVLSATLVVESGLQYAPDGDQRLTFSNTYVNDSEYDFNTGGSGTFAPTCDLPDATIEVGKGDSTATGDVNETTVQGSITDSGNHFRVVDCKYQYILSIPSLKGTGTYRVTINDADGHSIPTPDSNDNKVKFDLK